MIGQDSTTAAVPTLVATALPAEIVAELAAAAARLGWPLRTLGVGEPLLVLPPGTIILCGDPLSRLPLPPDVPPHVGVFVGRAFDGIVSFLRGGGAGTLRWPWPKQHTEALLIHLAGGIPGSVAEDLRPVRAV